MRKKVAKNFIIHDQIIKFYKYVKIWSQIMMPMEIQEADYIFKRVIIYL